MLCRKLWVGVTIRGAGLRGAAPHDEAVACLQFPEPEHQYFAHSHHGEYTRYTKPVRSLPIGPKVVPFWYYLIELYI